MSSAAAIALRLTPAQSRAMCPNESGWADEHKGKVFSQTIRTAERLHSLGLIETCHRLARPTELGLEVRAIIKGIEQP